MLLVNCKYICITACSALCSCYLYYVQSSHYCFRSLPIVNESEPLGYTMGPCVEDVEIPLASQSQTLFRGRMG